MDGSNRIQGNCNGYKRYINADVGDTYHHRLVAEEKLGRKLKPGEVVHHIDEDRENCAPKNILVFHTIGDHTRFHNAKHFHIEQLRDQSWVTILDPIPKICPCGKSFETFSKRRVYCEDQCPTRPFIKKRPDKEILESEIWLMPTSEIAKRYGVSDKAVEKWCKLYGLSKPPRGYWSKLRARNPSVF